MRAFHHRLVDESAPTFVAFTGEEFYVASSPSIDSDAGVPPARARGLPFSTSPPVGSLMTSARPWTIAFDRSPPRYASTGIGRALSTTLAPSPRSLRASSGITPHIIACGVQCVRGMRALNFIVTRQAHLLAFVDAGPAGIFASRHSVPCHRVRFVRA